MENEKTISLTLTLYDHSPVSKALEQAGALAIRTLHRIFGYPTNTSEISSECISAFCNCVNSLMKQATPTSIYQIHSKDSDSNPTLFTNRTDGWAVKGYAGILQFDLDSEHCPGLNKDENARVVLNIHSRFDQNNRNGYFLMYMFEKTSLAHGKAYLDMEIFSSTCNSWDLMLIITFVQQMQTAMKKGMFRQYRDYERNDSRIRGRIDIARHIRENPIFTGKISYTAREYTVDNPLNVLILRTYLCAKDKYPHILQRLLASHEVARQGIQILEQEVEYWQDTSDYSAMQNTDRPIAHSIYQDYESLRKTCHAILERLSINPYYQAETSDSPVSGLLVDLSHLWEDFLYCAVLQEYSGLDSPYAQDEHTIIGCRGFKPDFLVPSVWNPESGLPKPSAPYDMVLDAKYKRSWSETCYDEPDQTKAASTRISAWTKTRNDVFQILAYALSFNCKYCGAIFPVSVRCSSPKILKLAKEPRVVNQQLCRDRFFARLPYEIPDIPADVEDYRAEFEKSNQKLIAALNQLRRTTADTHDQSLDYESSALSHDSENDDE